MATTVQPHVAPADPAAAGAAIPPLQNGDRLTDREFLRRYRAMPELKKAELIEGRVYVGSPVSAKDHGGPHANVLTWLGYYQAFTPGVDIGDNSTVQLDRDNFSQPDAYLRIESGPGHQSTIGEHGYVYGAPELIVEIAATSAQYDLHEKLNVYRRNGVREYIVWRTFDTALDYFVLHESEFLRRDPDANGIFRSAVFPGLWLDAAALIRRDIGGVLRVAQQGIGSPEHAQFLQHLR